MGVSLKLDVNVSMEEDFVLEVEDVATEMNYWTYGSIDAHTDTAVRERFSRLDFYGHSSAFCSSSTPATMGDVTIQCVLE
ncbi:hypothetical protein Gorai_013582, partial [Gossypium raimondii]|nr:hypothetical protein [Gossypium raimondii]